MSANVEEFDLIVVGGGPGGSTLGSLVAQRGHRVLLLERERFPRYSIGESLLPVTVHGVCKLSGARDKIVDANFMRKYGGTWRWGREQALWSFDFKENEQLHLKQFDYAYQVEQSRFDEILLRHAAETGVDVREEHSVTGVVRDGERIAGVTFTDASGREKTARARFVADASGHQSSLHRLAGTRILSKFFRNVALFTYYENARRRPAPRQGDILCAAFDAGWFWFIPLSDTLTSVGAVIAPEHAGELQRDHEEAMRDFVARCPVIADLLAPATRVTEGVYGRFRVRSDYSYCNTQFHAPGLVLIGDSACFIDPVFSTGVHLATYSALLAARSINACLAGDVEETRLFEEFEHRYRAEFKNLYDFLLVIYQHESRQGFLFLERAEDRQYRGVRQSGVRPSRLRDGHVERRLLRATAQRRRRDGAPCCRNLLLGAGGASQAAGACRARAPRGLCRSEETAGSHCRRARRDHVLPSVPAFPGASVNGLVPSDDGLSWREPVPATVPV